MDIHDKIKMLRESNGWSQLEFADRIGVSRQTVSNWETGGGIPSIPHIKMIALQCRVSTDYIIYNDCPYQLSLLGIDDEEYNLLQSMIRMLEQKQKESV
ncbi:MAG: helix-turn-helix transcriptional regulator [Erysipelotrichaceae bacterium]|nr:helix-turn-helix transcriptional regulator [Erysipelotrichaceae bacterium]